MRTYFHIKDNILDKKITAVIETKQFAQRKIVTQHIGEVVSFFSENFTKNNDRSKAIELLDKHYSPLRRKDAVLLTFFSGLLTMIILLLLVMLAIPAENGKEFHRHHAWNEIFASLYTFRFLFMLILGLLSASFCIKIFTDYKINYVFIMELNPNYKITHIQLFRVAVILFTIWSFCLLG
jgi:hypothetical protein